MTSFKKVHGAFPATEAPESGFDQTGFFIFHVRLLIFSVLRFRDSFTIKRPVLEGIAGYV